MPPNSGFSLIVSGVALRFVIRYLVVCFYKEIVDMVLRAVGAGS